MLNVEENDPVKQHLPIKQGLKLNMKLNSNIDYWIIEKKVFEMAKPIQPGLVLEGEDAKQFFRNERNPMVSKKLVGMFKRAKEINEKNRF